MRRHPPGFGLASGLVTLAALAALVPGCVERRLLIQADPPASLVFVDGVELKDDPETHVPTVRYEHYGIRRVVVRAPAHAVHERLVTLDPPWWQIFPVDLVTDVLIPWTITDERAVLVKLEAAPEATSAAAGERALERADELARAAAEAAAADRARGATKEEKP